ncbi:MAG TPA: multidrug transporter, partial [Caulobacter sp.]|nr:multidrug transporter [Caulobacter sp.]
MSSPASKRALIACLLSASCLCACAAVPKLPPAQAIKAPAAYAAEASLATPTADWPSDRWWSAYGDPQLDALIAKVNVS